jgi:hypothetical protein
MARHRAISSPVRQQPRQYPAAPRTQTLMQGEAGGEVRSLALEFIEWFETTGAR